MFHMFSLTTQRGICRGRLGRLLPVHVRAISASNYTPPHPPPMEHAAYKQVSKSLTAPPLAGNLCEPESKMTYNDFLSAVKDNRVESITLARDMHIGKVKLRCAEGVEKTLVFPENYDVLGFLLAQNVNVDFVGGSVTSNNESDSLGKLFMVGLQVLGQIAFVGLVISMFMSARGGGSGMGGVGGGFLGMTSARGKLFESNEIETRFSDVAGAENAKRDLEEVVDFLKNPDKYSKVGARIPKGVLLSGPPGCGKTLLARSVAGEAGVPFFSTTGSSMVELFVGVAAARIRDMFKKAKEKSPCIIFIDEIDAIGKARSMSIAGGGSEERDQALNQLLTEMDGFDVNHGVIVIAATNRPDILDEALLRPGRFDRCVGVEMPDLRGREGILKVHTAGLPLGDGVNLNKLARNTVGFTGADLMNLCNEAAIYAARVSSDQVNTDHFDMALEKAMLGEEKRSLLVSESKRRVVAYHEAGHALLGIVVGDFDAVRKVSIIPRGAAGGVTYFEPSEDRLDGSLVTRTYLENKLVVALGGRVAEEIVFGYDQVTTGAAGDFQTVQHLATEMVRRYGFNVDIGPMLIEEGTFGDEVDSEVRAIVDRAYGRAQDLLQQHEFYLHRIAEALLEKETLNEDDLRKITEDIC